MHLIKTNNIRFYQIITDHILFVFLFNPNTIGLIKTIISDNIVYISKIIHLAKSIKLDVDSRVRIRGWYTPKENEPSQDKSSGEIPGETARCWRICFPTQPCIDGRARPPPWHEDVSHPPELPPSGSIVAHATATKEAPSQWWDPDSSPRCVSR